MKRNLNGGDFKMRFNKKIELNKKDLEKGLKFPLEMSDELAELIGIHFGDGSMIKRKHHGYRLQYSCNMSEKAYMGYIMNKFEELFNVSLKLYERTNKSCFELYFLSKALCTFFNELLDVPYSPKKDLKIPEKILKNKKYLISFLRGLFDTDGCVTFQRIGKYVYPLVKITTKDRLFAEQISNSFKLLGIPCFICRKEWNGDIGYDVVMRNKHAKNFFKIIGSRNQKNIQKFENLS